MALEFLVQGSDPMPYRLRATKKAGGVAFSCSCQAGAFGQMCKHRAALMRGDGAALVGDGRESLPALVALLAGSEASQMLSRLDDYEREADVLKKRISATKKAIAQLLID